MKKFLTFILLLGFLATAKGQENEVRNRLALGLKGGVNFSNIIRTGDNDFDTDYTTGFNAGIFVNIPLLDRLSIEPELLFSQKGYETADNGLFADRTFKQTTNWIEVPLKLKVLITPTFNMVLGPQFSFLTKTTNEFDGDFAQVEQTEYEDDADKFKKNILGGTIGFGVDLTDHLSINGRYAIDFQRNNEDGSSDIPEFKNQSWMLSLGIKF